MSINELKKSRVSFEIGTLCLMTVGLFFMCQIVQAADGVTTVVDQAASSTYTQRTTTVTATTSSGTNTSTTETKTEGDPALKAEIIPNVITTALKGTAQVQLISFKLTNTGSGSLKISELVIPGNYAVKNETDTKLYMGETAIGTVKVSDSKATVTGLNLNIPEGKSVTLTLEGDIAATNVKTAMVYNINAAGIKAVNAAGEAAKVTVSGSNSTIRIEKPQAKLKAEIVTNTATTIKKGTAQVQLIAFKVTNGGSEDATISRISVWGNFSGKDIANAVLFSGDTKLADRKGNASSRATFEGLSVKVKKGETVTFALKGDIVPTSVKKTLVYGLESCCLIKAKGASGASARVEVKNVISKLAIVSDATDTTPTVTPVVAALNVNLMDKRIEAVLGAKGVVLQEIKLKNDLNTAASFKIDGFDIIASNTGISIATVYFDKAYLYQDGKQLAEGSVSNARITFGTIVSVPARSTSVLVLKGDIGAGAALVTLTFKMDYESSFSSGGIVVSNQVNLTGSSSTVKIVSSATTAGTTAASEIKDGSLIRLAGSNDIYIVKIVDGKKYKRLILSPKVFASYVHLRWSNVIEVDQATFDSFTTSDLARVAGTSIVLKLTAAGATTVASSTIEQKSVYEINQAEASAYNR